MAKKRKASSPLQPALPSNSSATHRQSQDKQDIEELRQQLSDLQLRVVELERDNDDMQQHARQVCLVFSGSAIPAVAQGEDTAKLLQALLLQHMAFKLNHTQVKAAFRLRSQNIFVEFTRHLSI